ncbi:MAG: hypothetical protein WKF42_09255 [Solirubrobacteraceae bacterium]
MSVAQILDFLRGFFIYAIAIALPLAGVILALAKFTQRERDEAVRLLVASLLGVCLYALFFA